MVIDADFSNRKNTQNNRNETINDLNIAYFNSSKLFSPKTIFKSTLFWSLFENKYAFWYYFSMKFIIFPLLL